MGRGRKDHLAAWLDPTGLRTVNILFATYDHGDGYILRRSREVFSRRPSPVAAEPGTNRSECTSTTPRAAYRHDTDLFSVALA